MRDRLVRVVTLILICTLATASHAESTSVTIISKGIRLAGDLWRPQDMKEGETRPGLLLAHGWGGVKAHLNRAYAPRFAAAGYVVLTFDYRGWGESEGIVLRTGKKPVEGDQTTYTTEVREIRNVVNPLEQMDDIRAALHYLMSEPGVDPERLAIWGSSLGGGLVLRTATEFPEIKVALIQVGAVNPQADRNRTSDGQLVVAEGMRNYRAAIARGTQSYVPDRATPGLQGFPFYPDFERHDPYEHLVHLKAATLIIDAEDEELFDRRKNGLHLYQAIKDQVPARYETIEGAHYAAYQRAGLRKATAMQIEWLQQHLPVTGPGK